MIDIRLSVFCLSRLVQSPAQLIFECWFVMYLLLTIQMQTRIHVEAKLKGVFKFLGAQCTANRTGLRCVSENISWINKGIWIALEGGNFILRLTFAPIYANHRNVDAELLLSPPTAPPIAVWHALGKWRDPHRRLASFSNPLDRIDSIRDWPHVIPRIFVQLGAVWNGKSRIAFINNGVNIPKTATKSYSLQK